jgi:ubiquinone/menaquinone biosynthesis C-methylase UbiE
MAMKRALGMALLLIVGAALAGAQASNPRRDSIEEPERVMEATGVKPGMAIGEVGAGSGYFTFWLSRGVGPTGKVYANDIDRSALASLERRRDSEGVANIETVLGTVEDPRLPAGALDMVFMVNSFHDLERPVELLANLLPALKPDGTVVIMDRDPARAGDRHFLPREEVEEIVGRSVFEMVRVETFLRYHNLYILKAGKPARAGDVPLERAVRKPRPRGAISRAARPRAFR